MFKHILVPLDGSSLAEVVLPAAGYLARALRAQVTLVHIIEQDASASVHGERHLTGAKEAEEYLEDVARRAFPADLPVTRHVHTEAMEDVARGIVDHQAELAPDLVLMCTHGWSGLRDLLFGRIAQQVVASGRTPVLLVRPQRPQPKEPFLCRTLLAPTDGKPTHERGLEMAFELARATGARVQLLAVVPTMERLAGRQAASGRFMPGTTRAVLEVAQEQLESYLRHQAGRGQAGGVAVSASVRRGDPTSVIVETAASVDADIIVLGTHGKAGAEAFWAHSVTAGVLGKTTRPLLLVPVPPARHAGREVRSGREKE
jgi:nucleotide-binding universal stress UspA family protein